MDKSKLSQDQFQIIQEARTLRSKLAEIKRKNQQKTTQLIRTQLSDIYTQKFELFKVNLDQKTQDQLTSLQLAKELRISEICDVQNRLREFTNRLERQQKTLDSHQQDLKSSYQDALAFLDHQEQEELREWRRVKEQELSQKVAEYRQTIDIE